MTYDENANYCTLSPDTIFGIKINYGCYLHDRQYRNEVKVRKDRKQVDKDLRDYIINKFVEKGKKKLGFVVGNCYYYGCRFLGLFTWRKAK